MKLVAIAWRYARHFRILFLAGPASRMYSSHDSSFLVKELVSLKTDV